MMASLPTEIMGFFFQVHLKVRRTYSNSHRFNHYCSVYI